MNEAERIHYQIVWIGTGEWSERERERKKEGALNSKSESEQLEKRERERAPDTNIKGQKYLETEDRETKDGEIFAERVLEPFPAGF